MSEITIVPVQDRAALKRFIRLPVRLQAGDPNYIAPLEMERLDALRPGRNPLFEHLEAQYFLAVRAGRDVGRISAQVDRLVQEPDLGFFGLLASEDDPAVVEALFRAAEDWLRARGRSRVRGPFSLSINEETGLLVDGFDTPPMLMMPHDARYLAARVEAQGYTKARDMIAYLYDVLPSFPDRVVRLVQRAESQGMRIRPIDMGRLQEEFRLVMGIFNDAWSRNWGFVPFTEAELTHAAKAMKPLLDPRLTAVAEYKGEAVAFGILLPDLNEAIRDFGGRLLPFNWLKLLLRLKGVKGGRVPLMGVRRSFAAGLLGGMAPLAVIHHMKKGLDARGMRRIELSWILEDNLPMRRMIEALGSRAYKTYRVYEKTLPGTAGTPAAALTGRVV